jgi:hypothetical protein
VPSQTRCRTTGRPLNDDELVAYIHTGLDANFNPFVSSLIAKTEPISISELYAQLVTYENHMTIQARSGGSSANLANRGGRGGIHGHRGGRNDGCGHNGGYFNNNNNSGGYQHWEDEAQVDMTITIVPPVKCARELATPQIGASITSMKNMFLKRELQLLP